MDSSVIRACRQELALKIGRACDPSSPFWVFTLYLSFPCKDRVSILEVPYMPKSSSPVARPGEDRRETVFEDDGFSAVILQFLTSKHVRETVESVVIAFALAFLFRTFEAEAFVIPTGSMAPTLNGRHQDVDCPKCGYAYKVGTSGEVDSDSGVKLADLVASECPNCRYSTCTNSLLGEQLLTRRRHAERILLERQFGEQLFEQHPELPFNNDALQYATLSSSRNGDRIIVSKFIYDFHEPQRWDVFVFRYPGQASRNYIKRLVGLPGETLMIHRGDIFTKNFVPGTQAPKATDRFEIVRKPPDKVRSMAQVVHDNRYQSSELLKHWPARWNLWPRNSNPSAGAWQASDNNRVFEADGSAPQPTWIRYQHYVPSFNDWNRVIDGDSKALNPVPQLITDAYGYNSGCMVANSPDHRKADGFVDPPAAMGMYWVGDLLVECRAEIQGNSGNLMLDLVEGGKHFRCDIDVATGDARLTIDGGFVDKDENPIAAPVVKTPCKGPGTYDLMFANVDNQMLLWINGTLAGQAQYPPQKNVIPQSNTQNGGDLAPVGIGSNKVNVQISKLCVKRDVYYIAISQLSKSKGGWFTEYFSGPLYEPYWNKKDVQRATRQVMTSQKDWPRWFAKMRKREFPLSKFSGSNRNEDQFLALGDNSPQSKDGRLWAETFPHKEFYVERELLIGKALVIYWPLGHIEFVR